MKGRLVTRRRLAELNAQDWADFRAHWPMRVLDLIGELGGGFLFGVCLGLAAVLWALHSLGQA